VKVPLNGVTYTIRWLWNERGNAWFMDLSDLDGPILSGVRVVLNVDLLNNTADPRKPDGMMIAVAPDGVAEVDPTHDDLGEAVKVVFIDQADVEEP
jgi:hypothetical protein